MQKLNSIFPKVANRAQEYIQAYSLSQQLQFAP